MTILALSLTFVAGCACGWAATRIQIREREARAELRGLTNRRVLELSAEEAFRHCEGSS